MISQDQISQLKEYFARRPVDAVYLFGSQASGKATKLSDYDFGILFRQEINVQERFDERCRITGDLCGIMKAERVDTVDLQEAPIALRYAAVSPRKEVYVADNDRKVLFEADVLSRYFDYAYFIKQNTQYSLNSISQMKYGRN